MLTFDESAHVYAWNRRPVPSVTAIIRSALGDPFVSVPPDVLERKRALGRAVHRAAELDDAGRLDATSVHPEVEPYLRGWRAFRRDWPCVVRSSEVPMYHRMLGYAGTPDRVVVPVEASSWHIAICDLKTGLPGTYAALQTAGYSLLADQDGTGVILRFALRVFPNGTYKIEQHNGYGDTRDFLSCLNVSRLRERLANAQG